MSDEEAKVKEWTEEQVAEFLCSLGKGKAWQEYAKVCIAQGIDGSSLIAASPEDLIKDYSFKSLHAKLVCQSIAKLLAPPLPETTEVSTLCVLHQQPFQALCIEHDVLVCVVCLASNHHGHKSKDLEMAFEEEKAQIVTFISTARKRQVEFKKLITEMTARQEEVTQNSKVVKEQINQFFNDSGLSVEDQRMTLLGDLDRLNSSKTQVLSKQIINLQSAITKIDAEIHKVQSQTLLFKREFESFLSMNAVYTEPEVESDISFTINKSVEDSIQRLARIEAIGISPIHCEATGKGITSAYPNRSATFTIIAKSANGAQKNSGGETFQVVVKEVKTEVAIADNGDGTYTASYTLPMGVPGVVFIGVKTRGKHIHNSPFKVRVERPQTSFLNYRRASYGRESYNKGEKIVRTKKKKKGRGELWRYAVFDVRTTPETERSNNKIERKSKQTEKSEEEKKIIFKALKKIMFFKKLEKIQVNGIVNAMWVETFSAESIIAQPSTKKGDNAKYFYIIKEGEVNIKGGINPLGKVLKSGKTFGELALMHNLPQTKTITAVSDCKLWMVDRMLVKRIMVDSSAKKFEELMGFFQAVKVFQRLTEHQRNMLIEATVVAYFKQGDVIIREGEEGDMFYIVRKGTVKVNKITQGRNLTVAEYKIGDYFGERALTRKEKRAATVIATSKTLELLTLKKDVFSILVGSMNKQFRKRDKQYRKTVARLSENVGNSPHAVGSSISSVCTDLGLDSITETLSLDDLQETKGDPNDPNYMDYTNLNFDDLTVVGTLGRGAFGHVELVSDEKTSPGKKIMHALKTVNKALVHELQQVSHLRSEKRCLEQLHHPFLIRLRRTFNTDNNLHFLLEPCMGGELKTILEEKEYLDVEETRFISGCCLTAFEYMHKKGIVYRDLKPENILVSPNGYIKLTDFGFAKKIGGGRTYTLCGTPDYLAPEVVANQGHDINVDFWTIGILIFELLVGEPPFIDDNPMGIYQNIMIGNIQYPDDMKEEEIDIVNNFCTKVTARLGAVAGGYDTIRKHAFFKGFDWEGVRKQTLTPPASLIRPIKNDFDLTYFEDLLGEDERWRDWNPSVELPPGEIDPFENF